MIFSFVFIIGISTCGIVQGSCPDEQVEMNYLLSLSLEELGNLRTVPTALT